MAKPNKNVLIVSVLVVIGIAFLVLSKEPKKTTSEKVDMQNVFNQATTAVSPSATVDTAKDPVPSPAIVTSPEHGKEAGFAVQVYSFKDQKRADAALANLKKNGYKDSYIEISDLGTRGTWYRVRIGGLKNEDQAKALMESIRKNFQGGFIVKPVK